MFSEKNSSNNPFAIPYGLISAMVLLAPKGHNNDDTPTIQNFNYSSRFRPRLVVVDAESVAESKSGNFDIDAVDEALKCIENMGYDAKAVITQYKKRRGGTTNLSTLNNLEQARKLIFTPFKNNDTLGILAISDPVPFLLTSAAKTNGIVVSNRNFASYQNKNHEWDEVIEYRVIPFSWNGRSFQISESIMRNM
jgi:hypothetical protein